LPFGKCCGHLVNVFPFLVCFIKKSGSPDSNLRKLLRKNLILGNSMFRVKLLEKYDHCCCQMFQAEFSNFFQFVASSQGDQIQRIFAFWAIVYLGHVV
jgi:hypothetical protein